VIHDAERPIYLAAANPQDESPRHTALNLVGNHVSADPGIAESYGLLAIELGPEPMRMTARSSAFLSGNTHSLTPDRVDWQLLYCCNDFREVATADLPYPSNNSLPTFGRTARHPFPAVTASPSGAPLARLLADEAGAFPRDPMDTRLMTDPREGTFSRASQSMNPAGDALSSQWRTPPTPPPDADGDGMPDAWESAHGLDPADPTDGAGLGLSADATGVTGYTNLEAYLHARHLEVMATGRR
jgi:hypothetical protein